MYFPTVTVCASESACVSMWLYLCVCVFLLLSHWHWQGNIKQKFNVAWRCFVCHMKVIIFIKKSLNPTVTFFSFIRFFFFLYKLSNHRYLWVLFCKVVKNFKFTLGTASLSSQTHGAWRLLQSNAKLQGDSVGCLQPSHITLIDAAWLHRRLSTHSVCLAVESTWPSIDSSYTGCHLVDQFPLHSRKLNATPPLGSQRTQHVKIPYGWWGGWKSNHSPNAPNKSACKALFQSKT